MALRALELAANFDEAAAAQVAQERSIGGAAIARRWNASAMHLVEVLRDTDPQRRVTWVSGKLSARTLATTRLSESWIHANDIAAAMGTTLAPTDRLFHIARLAWRTLPYAFQMAHSTLQGPVAMILESPSGTTWTFTPTDSAVTTISGLAIDFCDVAARRKTPAETTLVGSGPDATRVLELVRTYAQ